VDEKLEISWFGRCCFLVEGFGKRVLIDPYDTFCNVNIGVIPADVLISSSTWHDHGNIGVSPKAYICTYPGRDSGSGLDIMGIEAKEERGTPNVIFNLKLGSFSVTNFADFGQEQEFSVEEKDRLKATNIAFIRSTNHYDLALKYCQPKIIFPEHYFPKSFVEEQVEESEKQRFLLPNIETDKMIERSDYQTVEVNTYKVTISANDLNSNKLIRFLRLNPQVRYSK